MNLRGYQRIAPFFGGGGGRKVHEDGKKLTCDLAIAKRKRRRSGLLSFTSLAKVSDYCTCRPNIASNNFPFGDVLGSEGRKALNACVKVKIYGKPKVRRYDGFKARERFQSCYVVQEGLRSRHVVIEFDQTDENAETYTIVDIHNALDKFDNMPYVEIYPKRGTGSDEIIKLIDKRRAEVKRELNEAEDNLGEKQKYSLAVAQRRVKDCYAGNFPSNEGIFGATGQSISIEAIYDSVHEFDARSLETCCYQNRCMYEQISEFRADVESKYNESAASTGTLHKYTVEEAQELLQKCYCGTDGPKKSRSHIGHNFNGCKLCGIYPLVCIFEIHDALCKYDNEMQKLHKYPEQGPGSDELKRSVDAHRADLKEEYENFLKGDESRPPASKYWCAEAEHRVRDCFACAFPGDVDLFPQKKDLSGMPRIYQTFDIFDIKTSLDYFDKKFFLERYPDKGHVTDEFKRKIEENRDSIACEYKEATAINEIEHGSGFIIQDHFVLTNRHVIETYLDDEHRYEIRLSNESIGELSCKVTHVDPDKDLALLYCPDLNLQESGICPLQLSTQPLLPGMQIFSFGYPMSHTEETALFVNGNVSGSKRNLFNHPMAVLNCSLNSGNSGGPVLSWVDGELRVVGIATQKHFKEILTLDEINTIENIRKSLQTHTISDVQEHDVNYLSRGAFLRGIPTSCHISLHLLTLKLYDALETHSQFNLSNALPGDLVVEFIKNFIPECNGEHKEELIKVVELSD